MATILDTFLHKVKPIFGLGQRDSASAVISAALDLEEQRRIAQISLFWDWYSGKHWPGDGEEGPLPYVNFCRIYIEKSIDWLVGNPPEFMSSPRLQPVMKHLYDEIIENSGGDAFFRELVQQGGVSGDALIKIDFDPQANHGEGGLAFKVMDSAKTFWEYRNVDQLKRLSRVLILWEEITASGDVRSRGELWDKDEIRVYGFTPDEFRLVYGVEPTLGDAQIGADKYGSYFVRPNAYGFLPFVHIKNQEISGESNGRSDLYDIWILNRELNKALVSYMDNCDYHGNPITLLYGVSARNIEKGADKIWGNLPKDARVQNLEVGQTFPMLQAYIGYMKEFMAVSSNTPESSLGVQTPISNTSAAALNMMFLPLTELTRRKRITYGKGLKDAMEMALKLMNSMNSLGLEALDHTDDGIAQSIAEIENISPAERGQSEQDTRALLAALKRISKLKKHPYYATEVLFKEPFLKDESFILSNAQLKTFIGVTSRQQIMRDLGEKDPIGRLREIKAEIDEFGMPNYPPMGTEGAGTLALDKNGNPIPASSRPPETAMQTADRSGQPAQDIALKRSMQGRQ